MFQVHDFYSRVFLNKNIDIEKVGTSSYPLPTFSEQLYMTICTLSIQHLKRQPTLINLTGNFVVVGDLHGNIHDLLRILRKNGSPSQTKYIFLGDYIDRGDYSLEVMTLLLTLMLMFPESVILLRGNHEVAEINKMYGFYAQIMKSKYSMNLYKKFNMVFDYLSLAAILNKETLLVHGGIGPNVQTLSAISSIKKPIELTEPVIEMLWSDPDMKTLTFSSSTRGQGCCFGISALRAFLMRCSLKRIIRGHQVEATGIGSFDDNRVITVFSSSCYCGRKNCSAIIHMENEKVITETYPPLKKSSSTISLLDFSMYGTPGFSISSSNPTFSTKSTALAKKPSITTTTQKESSKRAVTTHEKVQLKYESAPKREAKTPNVKIAKRETTISSSLAKRHNSIISVY